MDGLIQIQLLKAHFLRDSLVTLGGIKFQQLGSADPRLSPHISAGQRIRITATLVREEVGERK